MARHDTNGSSVLAPNDPYNDMEGANIRPDFGITNSSNKPQKAPTIAKPTNPKIYYAIPKVPPFLKKNQPLNLHGKTTSAAKVSPKTLPEKGRVNSARKRAALLQ